MTKAGIYRRAYPNALGFYSASLCVVTLLFAALFRYVPDTRVDWHDVWVGAVATALLFDLGKFGS
jgi:membrane protein